MASTIREPDLRAYIEELNRDHLRYWGPEARTLRLTLVPDAGEALFHARASVVASGTATVQAAVIGNPSPPVGPRDVKPTPTGVMIRDAAAGRMPAFVDTGLNLVHVDDVAEGHLLAFERGQVGERYILGGEDWSLRDLFGLVSEVAGVRAPRVELSQRALWPVAVASEALARGFGIAPRVTREMLAMSRKKMFFSSDKARRELGYAPRPVRAAVEDAVAWFRAHGMV